MFSFFRRKDTAVRYLLGGLLLMVCLSMVAYLIPGITSSSATDDAQTLAKVAGATITTTDLQKQLQQLTAGNRLPASMLPFYAPQVFQQQVSNRAILYEAKRLGFDATPNEIADALRQNSAFFPGGQFIGVDKYREIVETRTGMTVQQFEDNIRESLLVDKLRSLITDSIVISDADLDREFRNTNDKVKLDYVLVKASDFTAEVKVTEPELKAFFDKNHKDYTVPEKRNVKIVYLDQDKVKENIDVTEAELRQSYDRNKVRYKVEDSVQISHILLKTVGKTPEQVKDQEKKIGEVLQKARGGEDFAALVKQSSEDTDTVAKGGDVGWITHGMMVGDVEKAAFALEVGKISDVIKTQYGFQILKATGRKRAHQQTFEEVRAQILPQIKQEKGERVAAETADRLDAAVRRNPKSVEAVAAEMKLTVIQANNHALGDDIVGIGSPPPLDQAIFALKAGETSAIVPVGKNHAVVHVDQITPLRQAELAEVRVRVENDYKTDRAAQLLKTRSDDLAAKAKSLSDLKKAAAALKLTVKPSDPMNRDSRINEVGSIPGFPESAFHVKVGEIAGPFSAPSGMLVYTVTEQQFSPEEVVKLGRPSMRNSMMEGRRNIAFELFVDQLKDRLKKEGRLTVNEAALKRFTGALQP